ncbi:hypothetical protein SAMN05216223_103162 [Actinacidiphila yanglinensis]|uniref:Uncharacterized protein n=1 Tax=Actinacidiphila yanglinensis TaxID=310779 RepID=A0A1H5XAZ1_9ACTN|nr:hypothetical protein [Actinacidiphila yanglinensis]SEG08386.1 hypothetical protein SAMN05216223_103162 [Actinacidiphila yanglinensis]
MVIRGEGPRDWRGRGFGSPGGYGTKGAVDVPLSARPPQSGFSNCLSCLAVITVVVVLVLGLMVFLALRSLRTGPSAPSPDDVRTVAHSAGVSAAAAAAARRDAGAVDAVASALPAGRIGPDAVNDVCIGLVGGRDPKTAPVQCVRTTQAMIGGRGDLRSALRASDRGLRAHGWRPAGVTPGSPLPLPAGRPTPPHVIYLDGRGDRLTLTPSVLSRAYLPPGSAPQPSPRLVVQIPADPRLDGFRSATPGPSAATIAGAYAHHPFLLGIQVRDVYRTGEADAA